MNELFESIVQQVISVVFLFQITDTLTEPIVGKESSRDRYIFPFSNFHSFVPSRKSAKTFHDFIYRDIFKLFTMSEKRIGSQVQKVYRN